MIDVLIAGAGVSGLCTAWLLERAGLRTQVIESRDRVGGRTWSPRVEGTPLDLGASWIWSHEQHVLALCEQLGVETFESAPQGIDLVEHQGRVLHTQQAISWSPERRMVGGAQALCIALATHTHRLTLDTRVTSIVAHKDHVEVHGAHQSWRARQVVMALPPALCAATIAMPDLDARVVDAMRRTPTWMEQFAKVTVLFDTPFWRAQGLSGRAFSQRGPMREIHDISPHGEQTRGVLFGFVPGPRGEDDMEGLEAEVRAQLTRMFGVQGSAPIQVRHHAWWADPHAVPQAAGRVPKSEALFGHVVPQAAGRVPKSEALFGHAMWRDVYLDGRLHMASTETAAQHAGHIEGAVHRAHEVARTILDTLKRA